MIGSWDLLGWWQQAGHDGTAGSDGGGGAIHQWHCWLRGLLLMGVDGNEGREEMSFDCQGYRDRKGQWERGIESHHSSRAQSRHIKNLRG